MEDAYQWHQNPDTVDNDKIEPEVDELWAGMTLDA
jgi:hypothetical protein